MGGLVDDLLLLARLDQERPLAQEQVDLLQLAGDAVLDAEVSAPQRRVSFELGAPDPPPIVVGDPDRLRQVLANLLSNALRYTPPDTPVEVHLRTRRGTGTGDPGRAVLAVVDHGPGLSGEEAAHVFERFYRADTARSRDEGGAGLGLAIVAALVARHGGTVRHEPTPEGGATFVVTLPLAARDDAALISR
jgi:two-component system OmpR family sensor kinase